MYEHFLNSLIKNKKKNPNKLKLCDSKIENVNHQLLSEKMKN